MRVPAAIALTLLMACAAQAQIIRGKVLIPSVQTPDRVEVLLEKNDGQVLVRAFSDSQGNFEMRGMQAGGYEVVVNVEGYMEARMRVDVLPANQGATIVNIPVEKNPVEIIPAPVDPVVDITELNRNYPKKVLEDYEKAMEDLRKGETAKAQASLEAIVAAEPDFYTAHMTLGNLYQKQERFRDGEKEFKTAHELNPRSALPMTNLGSLYIQEAEAPSTRGRRLRGRILDDALDALDDAAKTDSHSAITFYLLGVAYYKSDFLEEAETNLKRAFDLDPHSSSTRLMFVNLYMKQEKWQDALDELDRYVMDYPKSTNRAQLEETRLKVIEKLKK